MKNKEELRSIASQFYAISKDKNMSKVKKYQEISKITKQLTTAEILEINDIIRESLKGI